MTITTEMMVIYNIWDDSGVNDYSAGLLVTMIATITIVMKDE